MEPAVNDPLVTAELSALSEEYEAALMANNVEKLVAFFWDSEYAIRFGVAESLYGAKEITEFRKTRPSVGLDRTEFNARVVTLGSDCGIVTLEFARNAAGLELQGRQTQVWWKFAAGWKIVSAHVSLVPRFYMDQAAALVGLPIPQQYREAVRINLERTAAIAKGLLAYPLSEANESAPVFEP